MHRPGRHRAGRAGGCAPARTPRPHTPAAGGRPLFSPGRGLPARWPRHPRPPPTWTWRSPPTHPAGRSGRAPRSRAPRPHAPCSGAPFSRPTPPPPSPRVSPARAGRGAGRRGGLAHHAHEGRCPHGVSRGGGSGRLRRGGWMRAGWRPVAAAFCLWRRAARVRRASGRACGYGTSRGGRPRRDHCRGQGRAPLSPSPKLPFLPVSGGTALPRHPAGGGRSEAAARRSAPPVDAVGRLTADPDRPAAATAAGRCWWSAPHRRRGSSPTRGVWPAPTTAAAYVGRVPVDWACKQPAAPHCSTVGGSLPRVWLEWGKQGER